MAWSGCVELLRYRVRLGIGRAGTIWRWRRNLKPGKYYPVYSGWIDTRRPSLMSRRGDSSRAWNALDGFSSIVATAFSMTNLLRSISRRQTSFSRLADSVHFRSSGKMIFQARGDSWILHVYNRDLDPSQYRTLRGKLAETLPVPEVLELGNRHVLEEKIEGLPIRELSEAKRRQVNTALLHRLSRRQHFPNGDISLDEQAVAAHEYVEKRTDYTNFDFMWLWRELQPLDRITVSHCDLTESNIVIQADGVVVLDLDPKLLALHPLFLDPLTLVFWCPEVGRTTSTFRDYWEGRLDGTLGCGVESIPASRKGVSRWLLFCTWSWYCARVAGWKEDELFRHGVCDYTLTFGEQPPWMRRDGVY